MRFCFQSATLVAQKLCFYGETAPPGRTVSTPPRSQPPLPRGNGISPGHFLLKNGKQLTPMFPTPHPVLLATKIEWLLPASARFAAGIEVLPHDRDRKSVV